MTHKNTSDSGGDATPTDTVSPQSDPARVSNAARDPRPIKRWLQSRFLSRRIKPGVRDKLAKKLDSVVLTEGQNHPPILEFFYAEDDPHSRLALQALMPLCQRYGLTPKIYRVDPPSGAHNPEPELLPKMAEHDVSLVAAAYGLSATLSPSIPGEYEAQNGPARRKALGHYGSAMFHFGGVWYWGVDRLCHLEQRLKRLDFDRQPEAACLYDRPSEVISAQSGIGYTLEWYGSLRSPYTAIGWPRVVNICNQAGIDLVLKPVLPMVMRGAPVSRPKGLYIFDDTAREAALYGQPFGPFFDPIGEPVRRAYRIFPEVREAGLEREFFGAFLRAAFTEGVNLAGSAGFKRVLRQSGLPVELYNIAKSNRELPAELDVNQQLMYSLPSWGVPTFRLLDKGGQEILHAFGQDRLWLIAQACR